MTKWLKYSASVAKREKSTTFAAMIFVTRAIIEQNGCVLAAQRPATMSLPFKWELPGGKMEEGESPVDCLARESMEELGLEIRIKESVEPVDRIFRDKLYRMLPFLCEVSGGEVVVHEHEQALWCPIDQLFELDWAPAEELVLRVWVESLPGQGTESFGISTEVAPMFEVEAPVCAAANW